MRAFFIFLAFELGSIVIGLRMLRRRMILVSKAKVIEGTVVDYYMEHARGRKVYYPIIEYYDESIQETKCFTSNVGSSSPIYGAGQTMELKYFDDGNGKQPLVNTWTAIWELPILFFMLGVPFIIVSLIALLLG